MSTPVNVLLVGGGGREHAMALKIAQSPRLGTLHVTHPENPGLAKLGTPVDVPVSTREIYRIEQYCDHNSIDLVAIGPEDPLADGWVDKLTTPNRRVFGPTKAGAQLEADKAWSKQLIRGGLLPTADGRIFDNAEFAKEYIRTRDEPQVIKAAGLAKGKGVILPETTEEGLDAIDRIMVQRIFGDAGTQIVIEERLTGPEISVLALVDGRNVLMLPPCQDHKRLLDGGAGPNTGGMGAYCPAPIADDDVLERIERQVLVPIVDTLRREGIEYHGVLYAGLILTHGGPKVLEFNVRFGDPECQPLMSRLDADLIELMIATCDGKLDQVEINWDPRPACCVVLAAHGYPDSPRIGDVITGVDEAEAMDGVTVYYAGAKLDAGTLVTSGGRVLGVNALGDDLDDARRKAYAACEKINFDGKVMRTDIAASAATVTEPH